MFTAQRPLPTAPARYERHDCYHHRLNVFSVVWVLTDSNLADAQTWIPSESLEESVIGAAHATSGYATWQTIYKMLQEHCYFPSMAGICKGYVSSCRRCKALNCTKDKTASLSRPDVPLGPWRLYLFKYY